MKKILAVAIVLLSAQAGAFYDNNGIYSSAYGGSGETAGNATGEGEATFSMDFKGRSYQSRNVQMNSASGGNLNSFYGYDRPGYYGQLPPAPAR